MTHKNRILLAGILGNLVETFDSMLCGLLSVYLAKYLVGPSSMRLTFVFLSFFVGYLARPLGAIFMGLFSDAYGRKNVLASSILLMGIATAWIGFIPEHNAIGNTSFVLLILLRLVQNFACGAEYFNSSSFLIECADENHQGYAGSWASFGNAAGFLLASIVCFFVAYVSELYPNFEWLIWRIPFGLALIGACVGLYVRLSIPESLAYILHYTESSKPTLSELLQETCCYLREEKKTTYTIISLCLLGVGSSFLIYIYAPIQATLYGHLTYRDTLLSNIISFSVMLFIYPIFGYLSDKINRTHIVLGASSCLLFLSPFYFNALTTQHLSHLIFMQALISIPVTAFCAVFPVILVEHFPLKLRCTALSILTSVTASLTAGFMPLFAFQLVKITHSPTSPAWILTGLILFMWAMIYKQQGKMLYYN